jgi:hypothetical protein
MAEKRPVRAYIDLLRGPQSPGTAYTRAILRAIGWGHGGGDPRRVLFCQIVNSLFFFMFRRALGGSKWSPEMEPGKAAQMQACAGITRQSGGSTAGENGPKCTPVDHEFLCSIMNFSVHLGLGVGDGRVDLA